MLAAALCKCRDCLAAHERRPCERQCCLWHGLGCPSAASVQLLPRETDRCDAVHRLCSGVQLAEQLDGCPLQVQATSAAAA